MGQSERLHPQPRKHFSVASSDAQADAEQRGERKGEQREGQHVQVGRAAQLLALLWVFDQGEQGRRERQHLEEVEAERSRR